MGGRWGCATHTISESGDSTDPSFPSTLCSLLPLPPLLLFPLILTLRLVLYTSAASLLFLESLVNLEQYALFDLLQSTGSFLRDNSITLGSLMGISNFLELSRRSSSTRRARQALSSESGVIKSKKTWLFSLCYRLSSGDEVEMKTPMAPSLGYLLEVERRASARFYGNVAHPAPHSTSHYRNAHLSLSYLCGYFCH